MSSYRIQETQAQRSSRFRPAPGVVARSRWTLLGRSCFQGGPDRIKHAAHKAARWFGSAARRSAAWSRLLPLLLCGLWLQAAAGPIFQYQDAAGDWHFTDAPPQDRDYSVVPDIATSIAKQQDSEHLGDLQQHLESLYAPDTPVAYATIAVVSIQTGSNEGSGFFCSPQGHILTTKHVVRQQGANDTEDRARELQAKEQDRDALADSFRNAREQLALMQEELNGYEALIESSRDEATQNWAKEARQRLSSRYRAEQKRLTDMERDLSALEPDLRESQRELSRDRTRPAVAQSRFDILLKDGTRLSANLVEVSESQDLALLKLDGHRTPYLQLHASPRLSQGTRVFAIGSPLGMQDAVTSGVVTQVTPEVVLTDAQILPGSSGGPLILENGEAVGINASRKVAAGTSKYSAGFGKAIPITLALTELPQLAAAIAAEAAEDQAQGPSTNEMGIPGSSPIEGLDLDQGTDPFAGPFEGEAQSEQTDSPPASDPSGEVPQKLFGPGQNDPPVRLIIPDQADNPEGRADTRPKETSLDFPSEGSVATPGLSYPRSEP